MPVARKRFGQHFLERTWVEKLMARLEIGAADTILEIGPGRGALTFPLANAAARVVAFEIDRDLVQSLRATDRPNLTVVEGDFLDTTPASLYRALAEGGVSQPARVTLRVAGNLPYNVASPILFTLIDLYRAGVPIADATVMLQREVADRLLAPPGSREYGVLSVLIGHTASVERLLALPPGAFRPPPAVRSAVVRLRFHADDPPVGDGRAFGGLVRAVFTRRRKTLANALLAYLPGEKMVIQGALARSGLDGRRRPESLTIAEFVRLSDAIGGSR